MVGARKVSYILYNGESGHEPTKLPPSCSHRVPPHTPPLSLPMHTVTPHHTPCHSHSHFMALQSPHQTTFPLSLNVSPHRITPVLHYTTLHYITLTLHDTTTPVTLFIISTPVTFFITPFSSCNTESLQLDYSSELQSYLCTSPLLASPLPSFSCCFYQ